LEILLGVCNFSPTPTTNLKMLFSAVSPEIRHRESKMRDISIGTDDDDLIDMNVEVVDVPDFGDDYDWKPGLSLRFMDFVFSESEILFKFVDLENGTLSSPFEASSDISANINMYTT
jgi:hypothetical protein